MRRPITEESSVAGGSVVSEGFEDKMEMIHEDYRMTYIRMVGELTFKTRINLYKILDSLGYTRHICGYMLDLFDHVGTARRERIINMVITFYVTRRMLFIDLIMSLKEPRLDEMISDLPLDMTQNFIELLFYLNPKQKKKETDLFIELTTELSFIDINGLMNYSDESFAKHCRLCRLKRMHVLEYRMQQGQLQPEHSATPGMLGKYEGGIDNWRADGEHFFTFDYEAARVFWRGKLVDLVKICDLCLNDTYRAIAEVNRFEPVNHLEGQEKKDFNAQLRSEERTRAELFRNLSVQRLHRHAKDWSVRALKSRREGLDREAKERAAATAKILQDRAEEAKRAERAHMLQDAKRVDKAWMKHEKVTQAARNSLRADGAALNFQHLYSRNGDPNISKSLPATREHPHSWQLAGFDDSKGGLPMSRAAASERFGTGKVELDVRTSELTLWKQQAAYLHRNHLDRVAAEERAQAAARTEECRVANERIASMHESMGRQAKLKRLAEEQAEEDRVEARADARVERRKLRLKRAEAAETALMEQEDARSWQHRYYLKECAIIAREMRNMQLQERAQCRIDNFWGIPTAIINSKNAKDDEDAAWLAKMDTLRALGMQTAVWVPYKAEIGTFRDRVTGLPIRPPRHVKEFQHYRAPGPDSNQHTRYNHTYKYEDLESKRLGTAGSSQRLR